MMLGSLVGQSKTLSVTFYDINGGLTNPSEITLTIVRVFQNETSLIETKAKADLENPSTGLFYYLFTPTLPGKYFVRYTTDDDPAVAIEDDFNVRAGYAVEA